MNLLLYLTALLLALSGLSYQALYRYQTENALRREWRVLLKEQSVCAFNDKVLEAYEAIRERGSGTASDQAPQNMEASAKINFRKLLSEKDPLYEKVAKNLIKILYGDQEFLKNNPEPLEQFFPSLQEAAKRNSPTSVRNMQGLRLEPDAVQELFTQLSKKVPVKDFCDASFTMFLTEKGSSKIRVFLAPPPLLMAIYPDEALVKDIVQMRQKLYNRHTKENAASLTEEFKQAFQGRSDYEEILDFSVTGTDPRGTKK